MKKFVLISILLVLGVSILVLGYLFKRDSKTADFIMESNYSSYMDSSELFSNYQDTANQSLLNDSNVSKKKALLYTENDENPPVYNYYIIVGSYKNKENAEKQKHFYDNKGYTAKIIRSDFDHFKVSIFSSINKNEALDSLNNLKMLDEFKNVWLLKRKM